MVQIEQVLIFVDLQLCNNLNECNELIELKKAGYVCQQHPLSSTPAIVFTKSKEAIIS